MDISANLNSSEIVDLVGMSYKVSEWYLEESIITTSHFPPISPFIDSCILEVINLLFVLFLIISYNVCAASLTSQYHCFRWRWNAVVMSEGILVWWLWGRPQARGGIVGSSNSVDPRILPLATFSNRRFGLGVSSHLYIDYIVHHVKSELVPC